MSVSASASSLIYRDGGFSEGRREVPEETAVAISVDGSTHAVMMATPADLEDLALGLVLNERIADGVGEVERIDVETVELGVDCRVWLSPERAATYVARRRQMTGPVGCGLCGVESLELAARPSPAVTRAAARFEPAAIVAAMEAMARRQALGRLTRAVHAAAFADAAGVPFVVREDVGRHNALDKVAGHLARERRDPAGGFLLTTSRVSVELIQKAAAMGCGLLAAVSAPTALAIRAAEGAGVTLVAVARGSEFELFTHPARVLGAAQAEAAIRAA